MTSSEIRASFLDFFREKGHTIVPSSPLLPDAPNLLFTNAGMNQFVPIFLGQTPAPQPPRIADTQKCIRAGGKHNDLEDVGFDTYHHTFFEMLGNWSFGDYFKKEAIAWAWELVVGRWNFPASRIYATVYCPNTNDWELIIRNAIAAKGDYQTFQGLPEMQGWRQYQGDAPNLEPYPDFEAACHWVKTFQQSGLDPEIHVVPGNKKDNFWMMGDTGPCGPCSELHVNLIPGPPEIDVDMRKQGRALVNSGDARCIEIWNLVFIQFNADPRAEFPLTDLPAKHVDTGMGFERVISMIQGTKGFTDFANAKISNYETDVFRPIFDELEKLTGKKYGSTLPASAQNETEQEKIDVAFRVIADHIRTLSFSIADGIQPSNEGRGYVLRRILRRAVRYGRNLGLREPFLGKLVAVLGKTMGPVFPEVVAKADLVKKTLTNEEESFFRTLERGIEMFEWVIAQQKTVLKDAAEKLPEKERELGDKLIALSNVFSGIQAFTLYDTYGFPLDLTELMARERGMAVDVVVFEELMEQQKARGRASQKKEIIAAAAIESSEDTPTKFVGYDPENYSVRTKLERVDEEDGRIAFAAEQSPFYVEMGGQVGDIGAATFKEKSFPIQCVQKNQNGVYWHIAEGSNLPKLIPYREITLQVDAPRRHKIEAHHSGTHLLNWALRKVLGNTITQKGSYVGPDRLRFDFSHGAAMTQEELAEVERLVNEKIEADVPVKWEERAYTEVKGDPSILQFFGDKYGETVRVVSIGDFSKELCGGTHVKHSGQVGYFKILHESAIAAGIRRIEAASGEALRAHVEELLRKQEEQLAHAGVAVDLRATVPSSAGIEPTVARRSTATTENLSDLWQHYKDREKLLHDMAAQRAQQEKEAAKQQEAMFQKRAAETAPDLIGAAADVNGVPFLGVEIDGAPAAYLPFLADALKTRWQGVAILATIDQGKVALLAAVAPAFTKKVQAGKIIQAMAPLVGGKGGGRPELAQGGGTNPQGVAAALAKAEELVRAL